MDKHAKKWTSTEEAALRREWEKDPHRARNDVNDFDSYMAGLLARSIKAIGMKRSEMGLVAFTRPSAKHSTDTNIFTLEIPEDCIQALSWVFNVKNIPTESESKVRKILTAAATQIESALYGFNVPNKPAMSVDSSFSKNTPEQDVIQQNIAASKSEV